MTQKIDTWPLFHTARKGALVVLALLITVLSATPAAALEWYLEFLDEAPDKLIWESELGVSYNLWHSETLVDPFVHVEGYPQVGTGNPMEYVFESGLKGFFRIDSAPQGFALIPEGPFEMGDAFDEGDGRELPVHTVFVSAFYMSTHEVSLALWEAVRIWGDENGYDDLPDGDGKGLNHPAYSMIWWDAMKWCNARSEMEGLEPCYYEDDDHTDVYREGGQRDIDNDRVKWRANGYRLPTEAEWEKAARGGLSGNRFPWGNMITHDVANYYSDGGYSYDQADPEGYKPGANDGDSPFTEPVGSLPPNEYGIYDMAGSVWEWCWDSYDSDYYDKSPLVDVDPRGPDDNDSRIIRGGSWGWSADEARCSYRQSGWGEHFDGSWDRFDDYGLRIVRGR